MYGSWNVSRPKQTRNSPKKRKKKKKNVRLSARSRSEPPKDNYRWVSVFSRCAASRRLKNLHKHISNPRGLATRRRNKWGRHVSGYSLFAGKHLLGFSELPRQKGRQKDGKNLACQPRRLGQRKMQTALAPLVGTTRPSSRQRGASLPMLARIKMLQIMGYLSRWCAVSLVALPLETSPA